MQVEKDTFPKKEESKKSKLLKLLFKIVITILCFWYISSKIDFSKSLQTLENANWGYLAIAVLLYFISKIVASYRLNIYFKNTQLHLSGTTNFKLYLLGLFYNLFLPGSIGGDAYKVILLKRRLQAPYRKTSAAVLLDRFTGLLGLGLVLCFYSFLVLSKTSYALGLLSAFLVITAVSFFVIKKWFPVFLPGFWPTFFWGLIVQVFANISAYAIMLSLGITIHLSEYMFIFLIASVAAVLPLTLGGLGAREIVFYQLSNYFNLDVHSSVLIGLLFYFMTFITSATGLVYIFKDPFTGSKNKNDLKTFKENIT
ncbi:MAG: flippase-like domain-containing protein [Bacteroidota bacterium]|nr:flippase-like domain-containing protein [Bacteroidota bacterium]